MSDLFDEDITPSTSFKSSISEFLIFVFPYFAKILKISPSLLEVIYSISFVRFLILSVSASFKLVFLLLNLYLHFH